MKLVTDQWKRRDGKPLIAVYESHNGYLLQVVDEKWLSNRGDGRHIGIGTDSQHDLLPVPREPTYRPFRDLAEAFAVMGPTPWIRLIGNASWRQIATVNGHDEPVIAFRGTTDIKSFRLRALLAECEWTSDPSSATGKVCGVEIQS